MGNVLSGSSTRSPHQIVYGERDIHQGELRVRPLDKLKDLSN
jgi:hypothetical protein